MPEVTLITAIGCYAQFPVMNSLCRVSLAVLATLSLESSRFAVEAVPVIPEPSRLSLATVSHLEIG